MIQRLGRRVAALTMAAFAGVAVSAYGAPQGQTPTTATGTAQASGATLAKPGAADLAAKPFMEQPKLAPDGKHYAARSVAGGKPLLVVVTVARDGKPEVQTFALPMKQTLRFFRWAGPGRLLLSFGQSSTFNAEPVYLTRLAMFDLATRKFSWLALGEMGFSGDDIVYVDPAGAYVLVAMQTTPYDYPSVHRFDLATAKHKKVAEARDHVWDWFADEQGVVRGAIGVEDGRWWMVYREKDGETFKRWINGTFSDDDNITDFHAVGGSDIGYATATNKNGRLALFRYDFKKATLGEVVWEHPTVDLDDVIFGADGAPRAIEYVDDRPRIHWLDPEMRRIQAGLDKAVPNATNRVISRSVDGAQMLIVSSSADRPPEYLLYDRPNRALDIAAAPYGKMGGKLLAPMRAVSYRARDGMEVPAYLTLPVGKPEKGLPLIVMPHGGPFVRDSWGYDPWVQFLAAKGYAVLQPNYRGSTGYGVDYVKAGYGQWGRAMQDDIDDGAKWLAAQGVADPKRVCIMGASFGGYAALWASVKSPELYRCAISFAGISDVGAMLRYDRKSFSASKYFRNWRSRVQGDTGFDLKAVSPLFVPAKLAMPLLIAHGSDDDNVPMSQSAKFHQALTLAGKPHEYVIYKDEGHGFASDVNETDFLNRVSAFLDQHNPS